MDGQHVAPATLGLAIRGAGHPMLVTDAMPPVGGSKEFMLQGTQIAVRDGRCVTPNGILAGSSLDMVTAVKNCVRLLGLPLERALRFASTEPADFLGVGHFVGRLAPGYRADIVALDSTDLSVLATWVAGKKSDGIRPGIARSCARVSERFRSARRRMSGCASVIIVVVVRKQDVAQMALAKDHNVIKAFASDRADQSFAMSILPRQARSRRLVANAHGAETSLEDVAIGAVTVANKICRRLFPAAGFG